MTAQLMLQVGVEGDLFDPHPENDQCREQGCQLACPLGKSHPHYSCRFCHVRLHRGDEDCECSTYRQPTRGASLCIECAEALDVLTADTLVGQIHRRLVSEGEMKFMPSSD